MFRKSNPPLGESINRMTRNGGNYSFNLTTDGHGSEVNGSRRRKQRGKVLHVLYELTHPDWYLSFVRIREIRVTVRSGEFSACFFSKNDLIVRMTIWLLAVLLLAALGALGFRQGAIRVTLSFFGIVIGGLLA